MKNTISSLVLVLLLAGSHHVAGQNFSWAESCNDSGKVVSLKVAVDANGNTYSVGYFKDTVTIGGATLEAVPGSLSYCLVKYDSLGNVKWVRSGGGVGGNEGSSVCVAGGNLYVAGDFHSSISFGGTTLSVTDTDAASSNLFVAKYDTSGTPIWARQSVGYCQVYRSNVSADAAGNVYVAGEFSDSLSLESTSLSGASQSFVAKYNQAGSLQWARQSTGTGYSGASSVVADTFGNVYITGFIEHTDSFGSFALASHGAADVYLIKYNAGGTVIWAKRAGGSGATALNGGNSVCVDDTGNIYVCGSIQGVADIGPFTITGSGMPCFFMAKFDTGGNVKWATAPTGVNMVSYGYSMAIDNLNNLYITGEYSGTMTLAGVPSITCAGGAGGVGGPYDVFVAGFSGTGSTLWALTAGGTGDDAGNSIAKNGRIISVTGGFFGAATFGSFTLNDALPSAGVSFIASLRDTAWNTGTEGVTNTVAATQAVPVYPNPVSGLLHVQLPASASTYHYVLYTITGQSVQEGILAPTIDLNALPDGQYIMKISGGNVAQTQRIIVLNQRF